VALENQNNYIRRAKREKNTHGKGGERDGAKEKSRKFTF
jgi:hypothetical protein